jgi:NAD-dependent dihydropyrimidine dehydrogenase PreA subunit
VLKKRVEENKFPVDQVYYDLAARLAPMDREYMPRIIALMATPQQARIVAALPDPDLKPAAAKTLEISDAFAAKLDMDKALIESHIHELFEKGLLFPTKKGPAMARTFLQLHDAALGNTNYDDKYGKLFYDLWGVIEGQMGKPAPAKPPTHSEGRIIPRWQSVKDVPGLQPFEDVHAILKGQELIVLLPCGCKRSHTDRSCEVPEQSCLTFGRTAQYNLDRRMGKKISYEEAVQVVERFDRLPVVHVSSNQREVNQLLCNCHYCCCLFMRYTMSSRFRSEVDAEKCKGCKVCVERCSFSANTMKEYPGLKGERAYSDPDVCRGCGSCVITCKSGARSMKLVHPPEHVPESGASMY